MLTLSFAKRFIYYDCTVAFKFVSDWNFILIAWLYKKIEFSGFNFCIFIVFQKWYIIAKGINKLLEQQQKYFNNVFLI